MENGPHEGSDESGAHAHVSRSSHAADSGSDHGRVRVDVLACDGGDPQVVETAFRSLGCETQSFSSHGAWLEQWPVGGPVKVADHPDIVAMIGSSAVIVGGGLLEATRQRLPDAKRLAVLTDASFSAAVAALKQSVNALTAYVPDPQAMALELSWLIESARESARTARQRTACRARYATLTRAEHEVLKALLDGKANKEIAELLGIGLRTVELRRSKIMRKMAAGNLAQLVKYICMVQGPNCGE